MGDSVVDAFGRYLHEFSQDQTEVRGGLREVDIIAPKTPNEEIAQLYRLRCGAVPGKPCDNLFTLLRQRESTNATFGRLRSADCKKLSSRYIPNGIDHLAQFSSRAFCNQFNKVGDTFAVAFQDQHIRLFSTDDDWTQHKEILARDVGWSIVDIDFSSDSKFLIYSTWSPYVHLCNVDGSVNVHEPLDFNPERPRFCLFSIEFSDDTKQIIGGGNDGCVYLYDLEQKKRVAKMKVGHEDINCVRWMDKNCATFLTGSDDGCCKMWDKRCFSADSKPVSTFVGHVEGITHIDVNSDSRFFISNGKDQCIKLWDSRKPHVGTYTAPERQHRHWDYRWESYEAEELASTVTDTSIMTYRGHRVLETLIRCYFSPDFSTSERYIYTGSQCGMIYIYDVLSGVLVKKLTGHSGAVRDMSWHPTRPTLISSCWDGTVARWDYQSD